MKFKSFIISLFLLIFLEIFSRYFFSGQIFWWVLILSVVFLAAAILWAVGLPFKKWFSLAFFAHIIYLLLPLIFYIASLFFLLLIQKTYLKHLFIIGSALLFLMMLLGIRGVILNLDYLIKPRLTYNFLVITTLWTVFLAHSIIWAFYRDLNLPIGLVMLISFVVNTVLLYSIFHLFASLRRRALIYALLTALIITEIIWVLCFWPLEYFLASLFLVIVFYVLWGLIHHQLEGSLNYKLVIEYLIVGTLTVILIFRIALIYLKI